uniref:Alpha-2-HS-glycoprotein n=1 Tax=Canis lupus dingo TaxID=286419 RepID=A0A8C0JYC5_CANLU
MKSLALFLCLAQLWGCHSVPVGPALVYRELDCDDPETEQAALVAVDYINNHVLRGYKHTLNQIDKVKVWPRRPMGEVFELEIDTLETTCHVLDPTPLANCSVRPQMQHAVEGDCDFRLLKQDGQFTVVVHTSGTPWSVQHRCPRCCLPASASPPFQVKSCCLINIFMYSPQPLPPSTYVEFAVAATDCVAAEVTDPAKCNLLAEKQYGFCKATLTEKVGGEDVAVTCTVFQTQPQPDGTEAVGPTVVADPGVTVPEASPDLPAAALVVGPVVVAIPEAPLPEHRAHYDLRHAFMGVASVESASGEAFHVGKVPKVVQPDVAVAAGPVVHPCPGRIRHFKI